MANHPGLLSSVDPSGLHLLGQAAACLGAFREAQDLLSPAAEGLREEGRLAASRSRSGSWHGRRCAAVSGTSLDRRRRNADASPRRHVSR